MVLWLKSVRMSSNMGIYDALCMILDLRKKQGRIGGNLNGN